MYLLQENLAAKPIPATIHRFEHFGLHMDQTDELIAELRAWVARRRGNQTLIRHALGVSKQTVSGWVTGYAKPSLDMGLKLLAFLKSHR